MKRGELKRTSELKRTGMKRKSPGKKARILEFKPPTKAEIEERSCGVCEICRQHKAAHKHHVVFKSHLGPGTLENGLDLCVVCHTACHETEAMRRYAEVVARELATGERPSNKDLFFFIA